MKDSCTASISYPRTSPSDNNRWLCGLSRHPLFSWITDSARGVWRSGHWNARKLCSSTHTASLFGSEASIIPFWRPESKDLHCSSARKLGSAPTFLSRQVRPSLWRNCNIFYHTNKVNDKEKQKKVGRTRTTVFRRLLKSDFSSDFRNISKNVSVVYIVVRGVKRVCLGVHSQQRYQ